MFTTLNPQCQELCLAQDRTANTSEAIIYQNKQISCTCTPCPHSCFQKHLSDTKPGLAYVGKCSMVQVGFFYSLKFQISCKAHIRQAHGHDVPFLNWRTWSHQQDSMGQQDSMEVG